MTLSRERAWLVAVVATLAMSVSYVDRQVVAAIATSVRRALDIDAQSFGWLAAAFSLAYLVTAPLAGMLVDRVGARRGLVVAILAWSIVSAAHALVPSFAALFALRILLGVTEAPSFPAAAQSVRRALPPGDRSAAFGLLFTGSSVGAAVAAPMAIWLDGRYGWRTTFVIASTVGLVWLPLWLLVTHDPKTRATLADPHPYRRGDPPTRAPRPVVPIGAVLSDPAVLRALVLVLASAPGLMFMFVWLPQYLELGRGLTRASLGAVLWIPPLMGDVGMVGFGLLASALDRRASAPRSHVSLVLLAAALETTLALVPFVDGSLAAVLLVGVAAAGGGGLYTLLTADMMSRVDPARVSMAGGMTAAAQSLVYVALNPLVGWSFDRWHTFDRAMILLAALAAPGAVVWSFWRPRLPAAHHGPPIE